MRNLFKMAFLAPIFLITGCFKDVTPEEQLAKDIEKIKEYLTEKNLTAESTASGLHYIIAVPGTGGSPNINSTVKVKYKGYLLDGSVFDENTQGISFPLANLIEGWQEGIPKLQKGGKGQFFVPSGMGYGTTKQGSIPANSVLIFDIELISF